MATKLLLPPYYLPSLRVLAAMYASQELLLEVCMPYQKQSYLNRCRVLMGRQPLALILPVCHDQGREKLSTTRLAEGARWPRHHWRTLCSAYGQAPYFGPLAELIAPCLCTPSTWLAELNIRLLKALLHFLRWPGKITLTSLYKPVYGAEVIDLRGVHHPKREPSLPTLPSYDHLMPGPFQANLSGLDLLFCEGPSGVELLEAISWPLKEYHQRPATPKPRG